MPYATLAIVPGREDALVDEILAERFDLIVASLGLFLPALVKGLDLLGRKQFALGKERAVFSNRI